MTPQERARLVETGATSLRAGDAMAARAAFELATADGQADASAWMALAAACRACADPDAELKALDEVLRLRPRDVRALVIKADRLAAAGDPRGAGAFYAAALKAAPSPLPPELKPLLDRAAEALRTQGAAYEDWLRASLPDAGRSPRFAQSLDLLFGRKQIYRQQPRIFYFPELPQVQVYPRDQTPWLAEVEAAADAIRAELRAVLADEAIRFEPYVQREADRPLDDRHFMLADPDWSAWFLWKDGSPVAEAQRRCPVAMAAMERVPLCRMPGRTPSVLFSALRPGARIPPHTGYVNTRLICHLPLIVPPPGASGAAALRVGNTVVEWKEGEAFAFDDTIEHEAANPTDALRVVLIFDVWRPELTEEERELVTRLFASIDAFGGAASEAWSS